MVSYDIDAKPMVMEEKRKARATPFPSPNHGLIIVKSN